MLIMLLLRADAKAKVGREDDDDDIHTQSLSKDRHYLYPGIQWIYYPDFYYI